MFSSRSEPEGGLTEFAQATESARAAGQIRWDLTVSNPTRVGLPQSQSQSQFLADAPRFPLADAFLPVLDGDYEPDSLGLLEAREAVSGVYRARGVAIPASDIVLTSSTSEAYSYLFKLLCDPGDDVLVPAPSYPLLAHLARAESVALSPYPLSYDGAWHIDSSALRAARGPRTRAVVAVSPNNPTGSYVTGAEFDELGRLGLPVICDEVFAEYPVEREEPGPCASSGSFSGSFSGSRTLTFSLGGLSKFAALPQLKLSWMAMSGPDPAVDAARARLELVADSYLSVATPVQAALRAILAGSAGTRDALLRRIRQNLGVLRQACAESPISVPRVEGGWYAVLRLPALMDEASWVMRLLDHGVLAQPGWFYDFQDAPYLVLSLIVEPSIFEPGVRELLAVVQAAAR